MRLPLHAVGIGLALIVATSSCSSEDGDPDAAPSETPSSPSSPSTASASESSAACTVPGFVPKDVEELQSVRPVAVYAAGRGLAPSSRMSGTETLERFDLAPIRVRLPAGPAPEDIRESVLDSVAAKGPRELPEQSGPHEFSLRNDSRSNQLHVLYRGAELLRGTWSATRCGEGYNDGTEVLELSGKFTALTPVRRMRTYLCGSEPADRFDRAAARICRL